MPIFLRKPLVNQLVERIHGSYDAFAAAWEEHATQERDASKAPSRSTLYRWVADGVPTHKDGSNHCIFTLCGLLDVDPLAVFDFHKNGYFTKFARMRQLIYYGRDALGGIATLLDMYRPADTWPSEIVAMKSFGHRWCGHHLTNKGECNNSNYILLSSCFSDERSLHPRAIHVAYRRHDVPDTMWRYYGTVLAIDGQIELYSESGTFQQRRQAQENEIQFRTYFGGRPVEWRVVSLHEFSLHSEYPSHEQTAVTFTW